MSSRIHIKNCRLYDRPSEQNPVDIYIDGAIIQAIGRDIDFPGATIIDAGGRIAVPGFIDVHIQGAGGSDILDGTEEALRNISQTLAQTGTTAFLGTTVVKPAEGNVHLDIARNFVGKGLPGATMLGFHIEGPFINKKKKGGLSEECIYGSSPEKLDEIFSVTGDALKMMTIAPEMPGNLNIIKTLVNYDVIASFAHSDATYEETIRGFEAGINHVTHIFNAMPPIHHRKPGPLTAIFEHDEITVQIISDGHHLHPSIVRLVHRIIGGDRCICITDGMHGIGLPEGMYLYNGREYESKDGAARYLDGTLIGSTMSLGEIAVKFMNFSGCTFETAIKTVSGIPAKLLGIDNKKGSLQPGKDADIVVLDDDYSVYGTIVEGSLVHMKEPQI
jgi:N-acetylglucosamine-6-phosphate deacetylase